MRLCGYQSLVIIIQLIQLIQGESAACGSLVTFRQYTVLLEQAPQCYRHGCDAGNASLTTISSPCSPLAPCYGLWKIISDRFHSDWCKSCHQHDVACRIQGWPILNTTSMCQFVPDDWIFYTDGECCNSGAEPFEIASWIGSMCNETWRDPFKVYGGMAKEDWEEWIQPWNWTVRPLNSTNQPTLQAHCSSGSSYLWEFARDNLLNLVEIFIEAWWKYRHKKKDPKRSMQARFWRSLPANLSLVLPFIRDIRLDLIQWFPVGVFHALCLIGSNVWSAAIIHNTAGYQHVSIVRLTVLFCARPRMPWMACILVVISHEYFVNAALSFALAEWILQLVGLYYLGFTTNTGRVRDFYHLNHVTPFWRGFDAHVMYSGSIFLVVVLIFFLLAFGYFMHVGREVLRWLLDLNDAGQQAGQPVKRNVGRKARQRAERAENNDFLSRMRNWSSRQIIKFRKVIPKILVPHLPTQIQQWEQQQRNRLSTAVKKVDNWFYTSGRQQASTYLPLQQTDLVDLEPVRRGTTPAQTTQMDRNRIQRTRDRTKITVTVAFFLGMCTFAAQWMFWDGFVKSSGDRCVNPFDLFICFCFSFFPKPSLQLDSLSLPLLFVPLFPPVKETTW